MSFILTEENYYSAEADREFMSCSQYQSFGECEAKALAKIQGRWEDKKKEAFLVGNYFHSYFEGKETHERFLNENFDDIFKTRKTKTDVIVTGKYAAFEKADEMIHVVENDPTMRYFLDMPGEVEQFMTGEIFGIPWRMKMDKYMPAERYIVDYKTVANIWDSFYNPLKGSRESFVEAHGYVFRAAIYSMIEMQNAFGISFEEAYQNLNELSDLPLPNFFLLCVSKQDPPDKDIIRVNSKQEYIFELEQVRKRIGRIQDIKAGIALPRRCGECDYCRSTKRITRIRSFHELTPEFRTGKMEREEDYVAADILTLSEAAELDEMPTV